MYVGSSGLSDSSAPHPERAVTGGWGAVEGEGEVVADSLGAVLSEAGAEGDSDGDSDVDSESVGEGSVATGSGVAGSGVGVTSVGSDVGDSETVGVSVPSVPSVPSATKAAASMSLPALVLVPLLVPASVLAPPDVIMWRRSPWGSFEATFPLIRASTPSERPTHAGSVPPREALCSAAPLSLSRVSQPDHFPDPAARVRTSTVPARSA
jgi:hypothetical protein